ncbi:MAG: two-component system response regulator UvrY [Gammaproteobacteria bacterium]|nr:MAG: two-component system response regulator UvrY [Gammaproteobacteria bacterium]
MTEIINNNEIRVLIVDDHDLVRYGFKSLLNEQDGIDVVDTVCCGEDAINWCRDHNGDIDVILMDVNMPGIGGIGATKRISQSWPIIGIIIITVHDGGPLPKILLKGGAKGYLTKGNAVDEMIAAIRDVHQGKYYIAKDIAQQLALSVLPGEINPLDILSMRETQVLMMIAQGTKTKKISEILNLSPKTISTYRMRLFEKLDVSSDIEMLHMAMKHGVLDENNMPIK